MPPQADDLTETPYRGTNREKAMTAKRTLFYCWCDRNHVSLTGKCEVCHRRINRKKRKIPAAT